MKKIKSINESLSINDSKPIVISGPCSAETEEQLIESSLALARTEKVDILRAGIWKPRTKPGNFEGIGSEALKWLSEAKKETGLKTAVEVANVKHVYQALKHGVDVLWIGARTSVNPFSVQEIADALEGVDITVLIKNPINPDISLWEGAIERIMNSGVSGVGAIHRGFSKFTESNYRNPPQWNLPIELKRRHPELTMICDPSHICGDRENLLRVSQKALDLNFDGLMIESHIDPDNAWSDAKQQITPQQLSIILDQLVVRNASPDINSLSDLLKLRDQIDQFDRELLDILGKRSKCAMDIGKFKKHNDMTILQTGRWDEVLNSRVELGNKVGLSQDLVSSIFNAIHKESINKQEEVLTANER